METETLFRPLGHPYYIAAPNYVESSGGVMALHYLCHALNLKGRDAYIAFAAKSSPELKTPFLTPEIMTRHERDRKVPIAVYPETLSGNPLLVPVCVRYLLNREGLISGRSMDAGKEDLFFWYSNRFVDEKDGENPRYLTVPYTNLDLFQPDPQRERRGTLLYVNRIPEAEIDFSRLPKDIEVLSNRRPVPLKDLAKILQGAKLLYSFEFSGTCSLARLCGCPVVYLRHPRHERLAVPAAIPAEEFPGCAFSDTPEAIEHARKTLPLCRPYFKKLCEPFWSQLDDFIQITQARACLLLPRQDEICVDLRMQRAVAAFQAEDFATAITFFSDLLEKAPENPLPSAYLAFIAARQGDARAAADFIGMAARIAPERADLKAALGESFLKAERPDLAATYLEEAIAAQPDLWSAYPAYAWSLHSTGQSEAAVALLQPVAGMASPARDSIQNALSEILAQQGNLDEFTRACLRFPRNAADDLLAVRCLSHFEANGERLLESLERIRKRLPADDAEKPVAKAGPSEAPLKIAFLVGDFAREQYLGRLPVLLRYLPPKRFILLLLMNDPQSGQDDCANLCRLLADRSWSIHGEEETRAIEIVREAAPDVLIDLDAYGPPESLAVFLKAEAPHKLLWGEAPMPPLSPECRVLTGARLESPLLPCVPLPEMGEYCDLPALPIVTPAAPATGKSPVFGVLTPAMRIGREGWLLFAEVLDCHPGGQLLINLDDLGEAARDFIGGIFAGAGIAAERLRFVHARTTEALCRLWLDVDLGLAPPTDAGDLALPACLWMGRPYLALASPLPWSRRPAALLELAGAEEWICRTPEDYIERARRLPPAPNPDFRARMKAAGLSDPILFAQGFAAAMSALAAWEMAIDRVEGTGGRAGCHPAPGRTGS